MYLIFNFIYKLNSILVHCYIMQYEGVKIDIKCKSINIITKILIEVNNFYIFNHT